MTLLYILYLLLKIYEKYVNLSVYVFICFKTNIRAVSLTFLLYFLIFLCSFSKKARNLKERECLFIQTNVLGASWFWFVACNCSTSSHVRVTALLAHASTWTQLWVWNIFPKLQHSCSNYKFCYNVANLYDSFLLCFLIILFILAFWSNEKMF